MSAALVKKLKSGLAVACFAFVGMALRLGLALLTADLNFGLTTSSARREDLCKKTTDASGYFLQNILGCFLIAAVARHKQKLNEHIAVGLSTGLCGSLTTWATWMENTAFTMLNGEVWMAFVSLICMLSVSQGSFVVGEITASCGMGVRPSIPIGPSSKGNDESVKSSSDEGTSTSAEEDPTAAQVDWALDIADGAAPAEPPRRLSDSNLLHAAIVVPCVLIVAAIVVALAAKNYTVGLLHMSVAPFGALVRWLLAMGNAYTAPLPVFTLLANTLGCAVDATSEVMVGRSEPGAWHDAWSSFGTGFGGCLSTVSTFMAELRADSLGGFRMRAAYFTISFALAMAVLLPTYSMAKC